jgi:hypothetical protein
VTPEHPTAVAMVERIADLYGIDSLLIWSKQRGPTLCEARQLACWAVREKTGWSYPEVGRALRLDHSTVIHGVRKTCAKVRDGTGTRFLKPAYDLLATDGVTAAKPVVEAVICPPSLVLSPSALPLVSSSFSADSGSLLSSDQRPVSKTAREPKAKVTRWRFVPADWSPNDAHRKLALVGRVSIDEEVQKFRDHEFKEPKSDPDRAFNRWLRTAAQGFGSSGIKPPGQGSHGEGGQSAPRRPELRPLLPPRPVQEATPLEVAAHLGQVLNRPAAPRVEQRGRMTAAELDRAVSEMQGRAKP